MPLLLEDLAEEASASNRRTADRLGAEARALEVLQGDLAALAELRHRAVESAQQATEYTLAGLPQVEAVWRSALDALRKKAIKDSEERFLRRVLEVFESGRQLTSHTRTLWKFAEAAGAAPERLDELERAEKRFEELAGQARAALEHRAQDWQPADAERLARGLRLAQEGKAVRAVEALARFQRPQS